MSNRALVNVAAGVVVGTVLAALIGPGPTLALFLGCWAALVAVRRLRGAP